MGAHKLVTGDTKRELRVGFTQAGTALTEQPLRVQMVVKTSGGLVTRDMTPDGENWIYRFSAGDFDTFTAGSYDVQFLLTWSDGAKATAPTTGKDRLVIIAKLS
ncbi:MAG: hypothetical protein ABS95_01520 [Verrucomicrobia bacterium SCN 57-15]|nr:MAG: hypothetical protein ABS95_01520 [Verrucomicrobia bacterium SCN 57-15]